MKLSIFLIVNIKLKHNQKFDGEHFVRGAVQIHVFDVNHWININKRVNEMGTKTRTTAKVCRSSDENRLRVAWLLLVLARYECTNKLPFGEKCSF